MDSGLWRCSLGDRRVLHENAALFEQVLGLHGYAGSYLAKQELDKLVSLVLEKDVEIFINCLARRITLDAYRQNVLFDFGPRGLANELLVLLAEHELALLLELRELLKILRDCHDLGC